MRLLTETNGRYRESHDFRDKSMDITGAVSEQSNANTGILRSEQFLLVRRINFQMGNLLGGDIVNVSVIQSYSIGTARLAGRVVKIKLQEPAKSGLITS